MILQQVYWAVSQPSSLSQKKWYMDDKREGLVCERLIGNAANKQSEMLWQSGYSKNVFFKITEAL